MVLVHFPQYRGPLHEKFDGCVPITPTTKQWYEGTKSVTRTMLPLFLAYAISIHKSQGMTLDNVIANIGPNEFSNGLTNTAITRVRKIENLTFSPFYHFSRFEKIFRQKIFLERKNHELKEKESDEKFPEKAKNMLWYPDDEQNDAD